ncbi:radical SAM family heme chaperone HemW [Neokomagataea thailandica]|uniref:Heme chaperone HemW n=1 Tax=Neokomagataea tanensis NBRC 106556 TaxID=1223519 RepID=A0ABQ0QJH0_9PROT|nr:MULTISPECIES: radical SAM family heme chaperone HemW [Neokomagataea]GBR47014.1 coproporphyrinogen III oxidase [Neokomagataea tanensis NBRC 106556]
MTDSLSLYIHWPFCLAKCPYCDFNSHVRDEIPQKRFAAALRRELAHDAARLGRRRLNAIFFGGGTPSLMAPETVAALIEDAKTLFDPVPDLEITLEANPTSVEASRLAAFREAGVNRVSLGIQSLREDALRLLGREHSAPQAIKALETARALFPRISFDLIYARPGQSPADWRDELSTALDLVADHLSLYQLTIEPGTKYEALHRRGEITLPDDETAATLYTLTGDVAATRGLLPYEVSNYAKPGCESRHNLTYWRYQDYLGIGPGAHGRMTFNSTLHATRRHRAPEPWAELVEKYGTGSREETPLSAEERGRESLLMGLRLTEGINAAAFQNRTSRSLTDCMDPDILTACLEEDYLSFDGTTLRATSEGRLRLESLLARLVL